jgi:hypothetical protein
VLGLISVIAAVVGILVAIAIPLEIERRKRPSLTIERADDLNAPAPNPFRLAHLRVTNQPLAGKLGKLLLRNAATGCRVDVVFKSRSDGKETYIPGRWSGLAEPLELHVLPTGQFARTYRQEAVPPTLVLDLSPDPAGHHVGIAIKRDGDRSAYAFTSESYAVSTMCLPRLELSDTEYDVIVRVHAGQVTRSKRFVLRNDGTAYTGLSLVKDK